MFSVLAVLVYLAAMGLPIYLLHQFHSQAWYWHALAVFAALVLGAVPIPAGMQTAGYDLAFGFLFIVCVIWGAGGLIMFRAHHEKHA